MSDEQATTVKGGNLLRWAYLAIKLVGQHPFASGAFAIIGLLGFALSIQSYRLDRLESQLATEQVASVQNAVAIVDHRIRSQGHAVELLNKAEGALRSTTDAAESSADVARRQFLVANKNAFRIAEILIVGDRNRFDSRVYLFEPYEMLRFLDRNRAERHNVDEPDPYFWGVCPYSILRCFYNSDISTEIQPNAVIFSLNSSAPHQASLNAFLKVCQKFLFENAQSMGEKICSGADPHRRDPTTRSSRTIRFSGTPGDRYLILFDADQKRGVDYGSLGELHVFEVWERTVDGAYRRIDWLEGSMESNNDWLTGDAIALVVDRTGKLQEVLAFDGFGSRLSIESGATIESFQADEANVLRTTRSITYRTKRTDEVDLRGNKLPNVLEVCVTQIGSRRFKEC